MSETVLLPPRYGKSIKYNRLTKDEALNVCYRKLRPNKPPIATVTCYDCYYHDGKCELGRDEGYPCVRFKRDWIYSNWVHHKILDDYDWCLKHFDDFCQLDREVFVAIYGFKRDDGLIEVRNINERFR